MAEEGKTVLSVETDGGNPEGVVANVTTEGVENTPAGNPSAEYDYSKMVGEHGALAENWREALPENLRSEKCLDSIKTVGALAQSYIHAQKAIGAGKVAVPNDKSTPEEWRAFYSATGCPEKKEDYAIDKIELPEGVVFDEALVGKFREFAFDHGMTQKQFEDALRFDADRVKAQIDRATSDGNAQYDATIAALNKEYPGKVDDAVGQAAKAISTFHLGDFVEKHHLQNNLEFIRAMIEIGGRISESKLAPGEGSAKVVNANDRVNEIINNLDDPYYHREHPAHKARVEEVKALLKAQSGK